MPLQIIRGFLGIGMSATERFRYNFINQLQLQQIFGRDLERLSSL